MPVIDIDRDDAREAAQRELAKPIYPRVSPKQQFIDFVDMLLRQLVDKGAAVPGGWFTISVLLIVLVVAMVAEIRIARRTLRTNRGDHPLFGPTELSAAEHRAAAERYAASGDWALPSGTGCAPSPANSSKPACWIRSRDAPPTSWPVTPARGCLGWPAN